MIVAIERSGGFAGIIKNYSADTSRLSSAGAAELRRLVEAAIAGEGGELRPAIPDSFQYSIAITGDDGRLTRLHWSTGFSNQAAGELVEWVTERK